MADRDIWTLGKACRVGNFRQIQFHKVEILEIVEELPHYNRCRVLVHGPVNGSAGQLYGGDIPIPPLRWGRGFYDPACTENLAEVNERWLAIGPGRKGQS